MMEVKAVKPFQDKQEGVTRKLGDAFTVSEERFEEINSTQHGVLVQVVAEEATERKACLDRMNKTELIEHAKGLKIELDPDMTKKEMLDKLQ